MSIKESEETKGKKALCIPIRLLEACTPLRGASRETRFARARATFPWRETISCNVVPCSVTALNTRLWRAIWHDVSLG